eukprot:6203597-Pleurochrysis_carterae.AAC.1
MVEIAASAPVLSSFALSVIFLGPSFPKFDWLHVHHDDGDYLFSPGAPGTEQLEALQRLHPASQATFAHLLQRVATLLLAASEEATNGGDEGDMAYEPFAEGGRDEQGYLEYEDGSNVAGDGDNFNDRVGGADGERADDGDDDGCGRLSGCDGGDGGCGSVLRGRMLCASSTCAAQDGGLCDAEDAAGDA